MKSRNKKIKKSLKAYWGYLCSKLWLILICLVFLDLIFCLLLYWKYVFLATRTEKEIFTGPSFNQVLFSQLDKDLAEKQASFEQTKKEQYLNIFSSFQIQNSTETPTSSQEE